MKNKTKAFVLLSGGLDSLLAVKILQKQNLEVEGICFKSNFYNSEKAVLGAGQIEIKLHILDISGEMLKLLKHPSRGFGKNLNPCINCHALMFKRANQYLKKKNKNYFLASGEVLGQRPFSQNKQALAAVSKVAGVEVLRPLSAKLLGETEIEKKGLVDRSNLGDISGRRREKQFALAKKFKIKSFPTPSGGCLLTDPEFSDRLRKMLDFWPKFSKNDVELLKNGRIFWFKISQKESILVVIGRNKAENENLNNIAKTGDFMLELKELTGPLTVVRISPSTLLSETFRTDNLQFKIPNKFEKINLKEKKKIEEVIKTACLLTGWYATKARGKKINFKIIKK